eukprot:14969987-Alexandrium_andersonii.AAC.1
MTNVSKTGQGPRANNELNTAMLQPTEAAHIQIHVQWHRPCATVNSQMPQMLMQYTSHNTAN